MIRVYRFVPPNPRNDLSPWNGNLAALVIDEIGNRGFLANFHAAESPHKKIGVKIFAAKLSVRYRLEPDLFLLGHDSSDSCIFGNP